MSYNPDYLWNKFAGLNTSAHPLKMEEATDPKASEAKLYAVLQTQVFDESSAKGDSKDLLRTADFQIRIHGADVTKVRDLVKKYVEILAAEDIAYVINGAVKDPQTGRYSALIAGSHVYQ